MDVGDAWLTSASTYYHEKLAPASDVDLFIYGLNEEQAIEKIKQIEASIKDCILEETTVSHESFYIFPRDLTHPQFSGRPHQKYDHHRIQVSRPPRADCATSV